VANAVTAPASGPAPRRIKPSFLVLSGLATLLVMMPFLFWHGVWFGRRLSNQDIERYLQDRDHPRKIQHALSQIADRMQRGGAGVSQWYSQVVSLAGHPAAQVRMTAAWVMGHDHNSEAFHQALLRLLKDPEVMVRRNAALSLVRFGDASGRTELVNTLRPYTLRTPEQGRVEIQAQPGEEVTAGTLLALVRRDQGGEVQVRAPFSGRVEGNAIKDGSTVAAGDELVQISPEPGQVWEALRGLYFVGQPEDLPEVERYSRGVANMPDSTRQQALSTIRAIRTRSERDATR